MKILICVPCMDQVAAQFAQSLAMLRKDEEETSVMFEISSLIYNARNHMAEQSVKMDFDATLWIDSDMVFDPMLLSDLLKTRRETGAEIVTAVCYRRRPPYTPTIFKKLDIHEDTQTADFAEYGIEELPKEPFEIEGCGMAATLVDTSVYLDVLSKYGSCFSPIGKNGEDAAFCWRARECGNKIVADPRIRIGHVGQMIVYKEMCKAYAESKKNGGV